MRLLSPPVVFAPALLIWLSLVGLALAVALVVALGLIWLSIALALVVALGLIWRSLDGPAFAACVAFAGTTFVPVVPTFALTFGLEKALSLTVFGSFATCSWLESTAAPSPCMP